MRERVTLRVTTAASEDRNQRDPGSIYSISYQDSSRDRAVKVVEILQNNLIENTLGQEEAGSR